MRIQSIKDLHRKVTLRHFEKIADELNRLHDLHSRKIRVLDIGCGNGWYWREGKLRDLLEKNVIELNVMDKTAPMTALAEVAIIHEGNAPESLGEFPPDYFDFVTTFDLIEHFPKSDGYRLLYQLDRISRFGSSVFTPNGFVWQPESENNVFNAHLSGWTPRELRKLGWARQYSAGGLKFLHGPYGMLTLKVPTRIEPLIGFLSNFLGNLHPKFGFAFLAISDGKNIRQITQDLV